VAQWTHLPAPRSVEQPWLLLAPALGPVLAGLALAAAGTFGAQAVATGFVGRVAPDRGAAGGAP
jgi:hypothetical protein